MNFNELTQISSRQNNKAKSWLKLNTPQGQKKYNQILIEGLRACLTALQNKAVIDTVLLTDNEAGKHIFERISQMAEQKGQAADWQDLIRKSFRVEAGLFCDIAAAKNPQGIIFIIEKPVLLSFAAWSRQIPQQKGKRKLLFLDRINDPGNLGTIIRTADAFAFDAIILMQGSTDPFNPKIMRSTMGSLFAIDLLTVQSYAELREICNEQKWALLISDMDGTDIAEFRQDQEERGFLICIGNEAHGVSPELKLFADQSLSIPMPGSAESLNAAIAFAIMAYEFADK